LYGLSAGRSRIQQDSDPAAAGYVSGSVLIVLGVRLALESR
jgi:hypothetical protein